MCIIKIQTVSFLFYSHKGRNGRKQDNTFKTETIEQRRTPTPPPLRSVPNSLRYKFLLIYFSGIKIPVEDQTLYDPNSLDFFIIKLFPPILKV